MKKYKKHINEGRLGSFLQDIVDGIWSKMKGEHLDFYNAIKQIKIEMNIPEDYLEKHEELIYDMVDDVKKHELPFVIESNDSINENTVNEYNLELAERIWSRIHNDNKNFIEAYKEVISEEGLTHSTQLKETLRDMIKEIDDYKTGDLGESVVNENNIYEYYQDIADKIWFTMNNDNVSFNTAYLESISSTNLEDSLELKETLALLIDENY